MGLPRLISIPALDISTAVESVGLNQKDLMDVPSSSRNVAWYNLGPKPGERGTAVIDGHYDDRVGPAVFYYLADLQPGNLIEITDSLGNLQKFKVTQVKSYPDSDFPTEKVFTSPDNNSYLNLITCDGIYSQSSHNYSRRLVVFSQKID